MLCVFCRRDVPLTKEHVFPQWTQPFLGDGVGRHTHIEITPDGSIEERSHRGRAATVTIRSICADCNNGWMSQLEEQAKPFLLSMLRGSTQTYHDQGRTLIATWLVKTALAAGSKSDPPLPPHFYTDLRRDQRPSDNTRVWLAGTPYDAHHQTDFRPIRTHDEDEPPPEKPNLFSALVVVGQIAGVVVSWEDRMPPVDNLLSTFGPALVEIWPIDGGGATWPPRAGALDFGALDVLPETIVSSNAEDS